MQESHKKPKILQSHSAWPAAMLSCGHTFTFTIYDWNYENRAKNLWARIFFRLYAVMVFTPDSQYRGKTTCQRLQLLNEQIKIKGSVHRPHHPLTAPSIWVAGFELKRQQTVCIYFDL